MLLFLFYVAGYLAGAACLLEAFEIPVRGAGFFAALAIFALLFFILYWLRKWARYTIPLTAVAFGLLAFRFSGRIAQGGVAFLRTVNRVVLLYTGASDRSIEHSPETLASLEIFLLFVLFLLGSLLFCGIYVKRGKWVPIFYSICVIGISLAVGKVPGILLTCLLAFPCLGEVAASGVRQPSIRRKVLLLTGVAALGQAPSSVVRLMAARRISTRSLTLIKPSPVRSPPTATVIGETVPSPRPMV